MNIIEFIKKKGKSVYIAKIRITDHDIEMFEDLATVYCNKGSKRKKPILMEFEKQYDKWLRKQFNEMQRFWKKYDNQKEVL